METGIKHPFIVSVLITVLGLTLAGRVTAQTFTTLHSFARLDTNTVNVGGAYPFGELLVSGTTLYGTTVYGGSGGGGTVFKLNSDGTGFTNLYSFSGFSGYFTNPSAGAVIGTNSDGAWPRGRLALSGDILYGATASGGPGGSGTVFAIRTDGSGFTTLYSFTESYGSNFTNSDGAFPTGGLLLSTNTLYGTTPYGGASGRGTVFAIKVDGPSFTNLHDFAGGTHAPRPYSGLTLSANSLYGTASSGGTSPDDQNLVFALNADGTGFTNLYSFTPLQSCSCNADGASPSELLVFSNTLYGTAFFGGTSGVGTVFKLNTNGTDFKTLHSFTAPDSDGAGPYAGLILLGNTLYGTTSHGGTVFRLGSDGSDFTTVYRFTDAEEPEGGALLLTGDTLFGTTYGGGWRSGTVFSLSFRPQLTIAPSGPNVILSWPTNFSGFDYSDYTLQSATNLGSSAFWTANLPAPVLVNGQNTVTNPISGTRKFYRLSQ